MSNPRTGGWGRELVCAVVLASLVAGSWAGEPMARGTPPAVPVHGLVHSIAPSPRVASSTIVREVLSHELAPGRSLPSLPANIAVSRVAPQPAGEPTVAVNRYGTLEVDWEEQGMPQNPVGPAGFSFSNDSGSTFGASLIPAIAGSSFEYDVTSGGLSPNGTIWLGFGSSPGSCGSGFTSDDRLVPMWGNGTHSGSPLNDIPCTAAGSGQFLDRDWLSTTPNGTVFQVVDDSSGNVWMGTVWGGSRMAPPKIVYVQGANGIPINALAYNDTLWAVADAGDSTGASGCFVTVSTNTGNSWTQGSSPSGCSNAGISWEVAWGAHATLDLDYVDSSGVEFVQSTDLGATWSSPVLLSGTVPSGTNFQTPTVMGDPSTGELEAVWLDTRAAVSTSGWNVYEVDSPDNGATWSAVRPLSNAIVGTGSSFWPGDFIWSIITPWGTAAAVWGDARGGQALTTTFGQVPLVNNADGNLSVSVQTIAGAAVPNAFVSVGGLPSRTSASGTVLYSALVPGSYQATASDPTLGSGSAIASVTKGVTSSVTITLGVTPVSVLATATPTSGPAPLSVAFNATASGGVPAYSFVWKFGDGGSAVVRDPTYIYAIPGNYTAWLWVNDSRSGGGTSSVVVHVSVPPLTLSGTATPPAGVVPVNVQVHLNATGGLAPFHFAVRFGDGHYASSAQSSRAFAASDSFAATGSYIIRAWVNDSALPAGRAVWSDVVNVSAPSPLAVSLSTNVSTGPEALSAAFTAAPSGGSEIYSTLSFAFGDGSIVNVSGSSRVVDHVFTTMGHFNATVTVTDSRGNVSTSSPVAVDVLGPVGVPALTVTVSVSPSTSVSVGETVALVASASGGSGAYLSYAWTFGDGQALTTTGPTASHSYATTGSFVVQVEVRDSFGERARANVGITVAPASSSSSSWTLGGIGWIYLVALSMIGAGGVAAAVIWRRRRRRSSMPPASGFVGAYNESAPYAAPAPTTWAPGSEAYDGYGPPN
ncbi:MAG: PKD domain-containing protein [Euryarchaeota archaeon]|nr:PKD domain-containing protein [Euryarchaeota archaeon]MDE2044308.1 PKD domain-containing protein [Thermoplasmata archaeon]